MKTTSKIFYAVSFLVLTSCSTNYYIPNTQNVPMVKDMGEGNINIAGNGGQAELQAAYGVGNSVAIQANGMVVFPQDEDNGKVGS